MNVLAGVAAATKGLVDDGREALLNSCTQYNQYCFCYHVSLNRNDTTCLLCPIDGCIILYKPGCLGWVHKPMVTASRLVAVAAAGCCCCCCCCSWLCLSVLEATCCTQALCFIQQLPGRSYLHCNRSPSASDTAASTLMPQLGVYRRTFSFSLPPS